MRIVVACGGTSPEREVSLDSGRAVASALEKGGHEVVIADIKSPLELVNKWDSYGADGVFIALHGDWGEDGTIQSCLGASGIPYTGSGPEACMCAMDKNISRLLFAQNGVKVADGYVKQRGGKFDGRDAAMLKKYGRVVLKPSTGGSTVGVSMPETREDFESGLVKSMDAYIYDDKTVVEQYIAGSEVTVPVWEKEDGEVIALPAIDIRPKSGYYDYTNKYTHGNTEYICPAPFSAEVTERLNKAAVAAHKSLGCRAYSRPDFRVTPDGEVYALEVNTAPGMTVNSLVPKAAVAYGMTLPDFLEKVIRVSFKIKRKYN